MNGSLGKLIVFRGVVWLSRVHNIRRLDRIDCREADGGIIAQGRDGFQRHVTGARDGQLIRPLGFKWRASVAAMVLTEISVIAPQLRRTETAVDAL
jgi:hypothetical protein